MNEFDLSYYANDLLQKKIISDFTLVLYTDVYCISYISRLINIIDVITFCYQSTSSGSDMSSLKIKLKWNRDKLNKLGAKPVCPKLPQSLTQTIPQS